MTVDLFLMIAVVTQRIKNLGQAEMRQMLANILRLGPQPPEFYDRAHRRRLQ